MTTVGLYPFRGSSTEIEGDRVLLRMDSKLGRALYGGRRPLLITVIVLFGCGSGSEDSIEHHATCPIQLRFARQVLMVPASRSGHIQNFLALDPNLTVRSSPSHS